MSQLDELKHEATRRRRNGAALTVAVVAVLLVGVGLFATFRGSEARVTTPGPQPPPAAVSTPGPLDAPLEPGRYSLPIHELDDMRVEVTVPAAGWTYADWGGIRGPGANAEGEPLESGTFVFLHVGRVPTDPCGFTHDSPVLPADHSPQQLLTALERQQDTTVSEPTDTVVGGYPALRVDVVESKDFTRDDCVLWVGGEEWDRFYGQGSSLDRSNPIWIVDVAGTTIVVDALGDKADSVDQQIVDSITFVRQ